MELAVAIADPHGHHFPLSQSSSQNGHRGGFSVFRPQWHLMKATIHDQNSPDCIVPLADQEVVKRGMREDSERCTY